MFPSALLVVSRTTKSWGKEILARMLICTTLYLYRPLLLHHAYYALILTWFYSDYDQIPRNVGEGDRSVESRVFKRATNDISFAIMLGRSGRIFKQEKRQNCLQNSSSQERVEIHERTK